MNFRCAGVLTIDMDGLSNAPRSSFLLTEGAFYVKGFLYPWITTEKCPNILIVTLAYDGGQIPVKDKQSSKRATLENKNNVGNLKPTVQNPSTINVAHVNSPLSD